MAEFLTTLGNSNYIERIICKAQEYIVLVSPYLRLSRNILDRLADANAKNIPITIIYGKEELDRKQKELLCQFENIELLFCANLHAKCYYNEQMLVVSSMNLHQYSEQNNREMGILIDREKDTELYNEVLQEVSSIKRISQLQKEIEHFSQKTENYIASEGTNFYESLYSKLRAKFPHKELVFRQFPYNVKADSLGYEIILNNFLNESIYLVINNRINLKFENRDEYIVYREKFKEEFSRKMPKTRFYWNYNVLMIYHPKEMERVDFLNHDYDVICMISNSYL